jgi:hypothetical protein
MKALIKSRGYIAPDGNVPFIIKKNDVNAEMIDFKRVNQYYNIAIGNIILSNDSYRIFLNGHYLTLIISESKEAKRPLHLHNIEWNFYRQYKYEVMKNIDIWLPGDNFYLVKHYLVAESNVLNIVLGKTIIN